MLPVTDLWQISLFPHDAKTIFRKMNQKFSSGKNNKVNKTELEDGWRKCKYTKQCAAVPIAQIQKH